MTFPFLSNFSNKIVHFFKTLLNLFIHPIPNQITFFFLLLNIIIFVKWSFSLSTHKLCVDVHPFDSLDFCRHLRLHRCNLKDGLRNGNVLCLVHSLTQCGLLHRCRSDLTRNLRLYGRHSIAKCRLDEFLCRRIRCGSTKLIVGSQQAMTIWWQSNARMWLDHRQWLCVFLFRNFGEDFSWRWTGEGFV